MTTGDVAAAERVAGVAYTEPERELMLGELEAQLRLTLARRTVALPHDLGPATRFDPRLPGFVMPDPGPLRLPDETGELPADPDGIAFAPAAALSAWIRSGALSCARLTALYLERIDRLAPRLACFAMVNGHAATERAAALDAMLAEGRWLGPLHGLPYGAKDILDTAGIETAWGAETHRGRVPTTDAAVVRRLREAGAVMLGKTSVGALAQGDVWYGGRTRNPWNVEQGASGSSAGSAAAVAAGLVAFALGTETHGSIVSPSARCGAVGLRPTFGRVSRLGAMPLCWSLDKIGPICRSVADTALVLAAINGHDEADPFGVAAPFGADLVAPVAGLRLGCFAQDFAHPLDRAALEAARGLGLKLVALTRPDLPYESLINLLTAEAAAAFEELTLTDRDDLLTRQDADAWPNEFRRARFLSAVDHVQLDRLRRRAMQAMDAAMRDVDAVIGPSLDGPMLTITNFTGHPCLCLPSGFRAPREPHSVSVWGRLFGEGPMLAVGHALERALAVSLRPPEP